MRSLLLTWVGTAGYDVPLDEKKTDGKEDEKIVGKERLEPLET